MLTHTVRGPDAAGKYAVGYATPGTSAFTIVVDGCSADAAGAEAARLNRQQAATEREIRSERQACGLRDTHPRKGGR